MQRSVETRASWIVAVAVLCILSMSYGAPLLTMVALKPIAADLGTARQAPALAGSLTYIGSGFGGILMGWLAERVGVRLIVLFGATMIAVGLAVAASGGLGLLYVGQGVLVGLFGASCMFSPLVTYVSRWFDHRRGSALALISSGQYLAGAIWPALFTLSMARFGWRVTMAGFGALVLLVILPIALAFLRRPPEGRAGAAQTGPRTGAPVLGLPPNLVLALLAAAIFCCCTTMSMPVGHLVALCTDLGIGAERGAAMLSVLLGTAFLARQFWGWLSDRVGGLHTVLYASAAQGTAMTGFLLTQSEAGLFTVSALFGLGFSGLAPAYVLAIRDLFPATEAGWRVPVVMFAGLLGMAAGGWLAGVIYDHYGYYAPAFSVGVAFNLANLAIVGALLSRRPARLTAAIG
jgi:MFS family permease